MHSESTEAARLVCAKEPMVEFNPRVRLSAPMLVIVSSYPTVSWNVELGEKSDGVGEKARESLVVGLGLGFRGSYVSGFGEHGPYSKWALE